MLIILKDQIFVCMHVLVGVPQQLRSDYGTENSWVAALHIAFHLQNESELGERSYIYGRSKRNVKILLNLTTCCSLIVEN